MSNHFVRLISFARKPYLGPMIPSDPSLTACLGANEGKKGGKNGQMLFLRQKVDARVTGWGASR